MSSRARPAPSYVAPALEKGLDVLECLAERAVALTQAQLSRELGRGPSEIYRVLTTLERRGYIERDPASGAYRLTLRLFELGHAHSPFDTLLRVADRPMRELADEIREGCHLSVVQRDRLLVLHQVEAPTRVRISVEVGSTIALHRSASGRVLLAAMDAAGRETPLAQDPEGVATSAERRALQARLELVRSRGFEEAQSESIAGVTDLAVLVGAPASRTQAALAIAALPRDRDAFIAEALEPLRRTAAAIARAAGLGAGNGHQES